MEARTDPTPTMPPKQENAWNDREPLHPPSKFQRGRTISSTVRRQRHVLESNSSSRVYHYKLPVCRQYGHFQPVPRNFRIAG
jgi:hypothetical protein